MEQIKFTYLVRSDYFSDEFIDSIFTARLNWIKVLDSDIPEYVNKKKRIDFIYLDGQNYLNPLYYSLPSYLKNVADDGKRVISFKNVLVDSFSKMPAMKKYVMTQTQIDLYNYYLAQNWQKFESSYKHFFSGKKIYIFKPVSGMRGLGIRVITSFAELKKYCWQIIKNHGSKWGKTEPNKETMRIFVLQEYIINPLLITKNGKKYKFHIRSFFVYQPGKKQSFYKKVGKMALAEEPYKHGDWTNKKIHDTHFLGMDKWLFTPKDTGISSAKFDKINQQIHTVYKVLNKLIKPYARCYPETVHCYQLFGVDFMITEDYQLKLLETNSSLGLGYNMTDNKAELFKGIIELIVDKYFPPFVKQLSVANAFVKLENPLKQLPTKTLKQGKILQRVKTLKQVGF